MEENQPKPSSTAWTYGLIIGGVSIMFSLMLYFADLLYDQSKLIQYFPLMLLFIGVVLGVIQFKKLNQGFLQLGQAVKLGAGLALIFALVSLLYLLFQIQFLEPEFIDKTLDIQKQIAIADNPKAEDLIEKQFEMQKEYAWVLYPVGIILNVIAGLFFGLITGLIMKKQKPAY